MKDIYKIIEKYSPTNDIFSEEEESVTKLKNIIYTKLNDIDLRLILLYAEEGSYRKLAAVLGVSATAAYYRIKQIKDFILKEYANS